MMSLQLKMRRLRFKKKLALLFMLAQRMILGLTKVIILISKSFQFQEKGSIKRLMIDTKKIFKKKD
jgi:hypothetical protein